MDLKSAALFPAVFTGIILVSLN